MSDLKKSVEAILFSSGRKVPLEELGKLCKADADSVKKELNSLKQDYDANNSSLMIVEEGDSWKITVREEYLPLVRKIVTETELTKSVMETLAVIAFKAPVKQSDVIKVRTNKAYEHLSELEIAGYVTREKYGRTKIIKLSQKFFEYFDIPPEKLKEKFKKFEDMEKVIINKEEEIEKKRSEIEQKNKDASDKAKKQSENKQLDNLDIYEPEANPQKVGELEIYESKEDLAEKKKEKKGASKAEAEAGDVELEFGDEDDKGSSASGEDNDEDETEDGEDDDEDSEEKEELSEETKDGNEEKPELKSSKKKYEDNSERELSEGLESELKTKR